MVFPAPRPNFLRRWIAQPRGLALGVLNNQHLIGYGVLRPCRQGFKIGPLFADDPETADALFRGLASRVSDQPIFLDTPEVNPAAILIAQRHKMQPVDGTHVHEGTSRHADRSLLRRNDVRTRLGRSEQ